MYPFSWYKRSKFQFAPIFRENKFVYHLCYTQTSGRKLLQGRAEFGANVNFRVKLTIVTLLLYDMYTKRYIYMYFIVILTHKEFSASKLGGIHLFWKYHIEKNRNQSWQINHTWVGFAHEISFIWYDEMWRKWFQSSTTPFCDFLSGKNRNFQNILWKTVDDRSSGNRHQMSVIFVLLLSEFSIAYISRTGVRIAEIFSPVCIVRQSLSIQQIKKCGTPPLNYENSLCWATPVNKLPLKVKKWNKF